MPAFSPTPQRMNPDSSMLSSAGPADFGGFSDYSNPSPSIKKIVNVKTILERNDTKVNPVGETYSQSKTPKVVDKKMEEIFKTNNPFANLKLNSSVMYSKSTPKNESEIETEHPEEEKVKIIGKRNSKFSTMLKNIAAQEEITDPFTRRNSIKINDRDKTKGHIKFRSKSKDKNKYTDKILLNQLESREVEDNIDIDQRKKNSLAGKLKQQFQNKKINDLKTPDKLDKHIMEKFKRDKSETTNGVAILDEEIRNENYSEKDKLAANIFEDFEKQESWQSYTTLLFADISTDFNAMDSKNSPTKKGGNKTLTNETKKK